MSEQHPVADQVGKRARTQHSAVLEVHHDASQLEERQAGRKLGRETGLQGEDGGLVAEQIMPGAQGQGKKG